MEFPKQQDQKIPECQKKALQKQDFQDFRIGKMRWDVILKNWTLSEE